MSERIDLPEDGPARIVIERVGGDLRLRGGDRSEIAAKGDNPQVVQTETGEVRVTSDGDLTLRIPSNSDVEVGAVGGDAKITDVLGSLTLGNVGSDLILRNVGPLAVGNVGSDLRLKRARGDVQVAHVGSDATVREVEGTVTLDHVGADLYIRDAESICCAEHVGGDLVLSTDFAEGAEYRFNAGGDIVCRVPPDANARIHPTQGGDLILDAPEAQVAEGDDGEEVIFGSGAAQVYLEAGGDIRLVGPDEDYMMAMNFQLEEELESRLAGLDKIINESLAGLDQMINSQVEQAMRKAGKAARQAERQIERQLERMDRGSAKQKRHGFGFGISFGTPHGPRGPQPPRPPEPPGEPVSDEERLLILRMVEARQITVEEAEKLLSALEGRGK